MGISAYFLQGHPVSLAWVRILPVPLHAPTGQSTGVRGQSPGQDINAPLLATVSVHVTSHKLYQFYPISQVSPFKPEIK